ncbi:uncharacterized protein BDW43DRAFT_292747 [Aspergillus alliaceus]|uniref:uncharacterized protein n=1 Tax=Petromyces alliaceus TaxID=209559 RepID=UPI0012A70A79|nr:uncharacterized protein BDW43DRAFT_292747 [Aspergillus alliaceus]KAB8227882.1 hypothetical protein BDW43DRAFT_292747 [Aspergillus alliaceus]
MRFLLDSKCRITDGSCLSPYIHSLDLPQCGNRTLIQAGISVCQISCHCYGERHFHCYPFLHPAISPRLVSCMYICCTCGNGPVAYHLQPRCSVCSHTVCANCQITQIF